MSWIETEIDAICYKVTSGGTPSTKEERYYGGEIPWLRTQEVVFNNIYDTDIKITADGLKNSAAKWIPADSVIVAMYGNSAGRVAINKIALTTNQACCNLIIDPAKADFKFIYHALTKDYETLHGLARGAAQNNLNAADVKRYKVKLPPLLVQKKIASILSAYDELIDNNRKRIALLEKAARLLYEEWFVRLQFPGHEHTPVVDGVPQGWEVKRLDKVAEVNALSLKSNSQGEIEYIDISAVSPGSIDGTTLYEFADAPGRARRIVRHGDIIWSCVRPNRKSYAIIWDPTPNLIASTGFAVLSPTKVPPCFLLQATTTDGFVGYLNNNARGAAYPAVTAKDFEAAQILVPTSALLASFEATCNPILSQVKTFGLQIQKLQQARDLLLPRLMSGELAV